MSHETKAEQTTASTAEHSVLTAEELESVSGGTIIPAGPDVLLPPIICPPPPVVVVDGPTIGDS